MGELGLVVRSFHASGSSLEKPDEGRAVGLVRRCRPAELVRVESGSEIGGRAQRVEPEVVPVGSTGRRLRAVPPGVAEIVASRHGAFWGLAYIECGVHWGNSAD